MGSATDFVVITVPVSTSLQQLEAMRSACLVRALSESSVVGKAHNQAQTVGRSVTVDRHLANLQGERWMHRLL